MSPLILNSSLIPLSIGNRKKRGGPNLVMRRYNSPFQCLATPNNIPQRNSANYQPNFWSYDFLQSLKHDYAVVFHSFIYIYIYIYIYRFNAYMYSVTMLLIHDFLLHTQDVRYEDRAKKLREEVRRMIKHGNGEIWDTLELIDHVKRLGLSYQCREEIAKPLIGFCHWTDLRVNYIDLPKDSV